MFVPLQPGHRFAAGMLPVDLRASTGVESSSSASSITRPCGVVEAGDLLLSNRALGVLDPGLY